MKEETKRYFLTSYYRVDERIVQTIQEYQKILKDAAYNNSREKSDFLFGNITCSKEKDGIHVTGHLYKKLTNREQLSTLLNIVASNDLKSLAELYKDKIEVEEGYIPDINIAYLESKDTRGKNKAPSNRTYYENGIRYLPMMFIQDRKFFSIPFLRKCISFHGEKCDYKFFSKMANEFEKNTDVLDHCIRLRAEVDKVENQGHSGKYMECLGFDLFDAFLREREKDGTAVRLEDGSFQISKRRLLDAAAFIKFYGSEKYKTNYPLRDNKKPTEKKKKELEEEERRKNELKLIMSGKAHYEQLTFF